MTFRLEEAVVRAKASGDCSELLAAIPYASFVGYRAEAGRERWTGILEPSETIIGNPGLPAIHGGAIGMLLETTAALQVLFEMETIVLPRVVGITVSYLRSARLERTYAEATVTRHGRRIASVHVVSWQGAREPVDRVIATAQVNLLVTPADLQQGR